MELLEYEQYYQIFGVQTEVNEKDFIVELLENYRKLIVAEDVDTITEIMQIYTDRGEYGKASFWMQKRENSSARTTQLLPAFISTGNGEPSAGEKVTAEIARKVWKVFAGREDIYSRESIGSGGRRDMEYVALPLTEHEVCRHMRGEETIGTYIRHPNNTVEYLVIDIDISKRVMLQYNREGEMFHVYLKKAFQKAESVKKLLRTFGIEGYVEYSGCRGYHIWIFFYGVDSCEVC